MIARALAICLLALPLLGCATDADDARLAAAMTDQDEAVADRLLQRTLEFVPDGTTRRWRNEESGHAGAITPVGTFVSAAGVFCREYREELRVAGADAAATKAACRDPAARWIALEVLEFPVR